MFYTVVGISEIEGVSNKTGNQYHSILLHCMYKDRNVTGQAVDTIFLNASHYSVGDFAIGGNYDVDRNNKGFVVDVRPA